MARFYDTINDTDLIRVENQLKKNGVVFTLQTLHGESALIREIMVAEEDMAAAEWAVCGNS